MEPIIFLPIKRWTWTSNCKRSSPEIDCARCRCTISSANIILREHILIFTKEMNIFYQIQETLDQYTCSYDIIQILSKIIKKLYIMCFWKMKD